jgi:hypothetical protein
VITHEMNRADLLVNLPVQHFEKGAKVLLSLPLIALSLDLARTGVKGRQEVERPGPPVLRLVAVRHGLRLRWEGRRVARSRLEGSCLVHRQDQLLWAQWTGLEVDHLRYGGIEGGGPRRMGKSRPPTGGYSSPDEPVLPRGWSPVATVPASDAPQERGQCAMRTCGRVPA